MEGSEAAYLSRRKLLEIYGVDLPAKNLAQYWQPYHNHFFSGWADVVLHQAP